MTNQQNPISHPISADSSVHLNNPNFDINDFLNHFESPETLYYFEHPEDRKFIGFDGNGWNDSLKADKIVWATYRVLDVWGTIKKMTKVIGTDYSTHNLYKSLYLRKDISYGHHLTELMSNVSRQFARGIEGDNQLQTDALVAAAVISTFRIITRPAISLLHFANERSLKRLDQSHGELGGGLEYKNDKQRSSIYNETDADKFKKHYKEFLQHNLDINQKTIKDFESKIQTQIDTHKATINNLEHDIRSLSSNDNTNANTVNAQAIQAKKNEITELKNKIKTISESTTPEVDLAQQRVETLNTKITETKGIKTFSIRDGKKVDITSFAIGFGKRVAESIALDEDNSHELVASKVAAMMYTLAGIGYDGIEIWDVQKKFSKFSKSLWTAGASFGTTGAALEIADVAKILDDPNLTEQQRRYMQAEIGLQSSVMFLSSVEGLFSSIQSASVVGSKIAGFLGKAVPAIAAVSIVAGGINPGRWAEFQQKEKYIKEVGERDEHSSALLAELLDDSLETEKGYYAASNIVDGMAGVGASALAATGFGAGAAIGIGLIGGTISAIIQSTQQVALEAIADRYAKRMRADKHGNEQSIEAYFKGSFDQQQEQMKKKHKGFFDDLVDEGYDNIIAMGSQTLARSDLSLAAITKTGGELGKTAKHYFEQYIAQDMWQAGAIQLRAVKGADEIYLPDNGNSKRYVTFMSPLMASGEEKLIRAKDGKNKYYTSLEIKDMAGWKVIDQGKSNTVFSTTSVVTSAEYASGKTLKINFQIDAQQGNDTYLASEVETKFDGGAGQDIASYAGTEGLATGLIIGSDKDNISVLKVFGSEANRIYETIETYTERYGKRTETIEYRRIRLDKSDEKEANNVNILEILNTVILKGNELKGIDVLKQVNNLRADADIIRTSDIFALAAAAERVEKYVATDQLSNTEILQTTDLNDIIDLRELKGSDVLMQLYTFDGADIIRTGDFVSLVSAGDGHDTIYIGKGIKHVFAEAGDDVISLQALDMGTIRNTEQTNPTEEDTSSYVGTLYGALIDTYYRRQWDADSLRRYAERHDSQAKDSLKGEIKGTLSYYTTKHIKGQIYVEQGKTYEFREVVDDYASLYVDGSKVLLDDSWHKHTRGTYTAYKSGLVDFDFYVYNERGAGNFNISYRVIGEENSFKTMEAETKQFHMLTQTSDSGQETAASDPNAAEYAGTIYGATIGGYYRRQFDADSLRPHADRYEPQTKESLNGEIKGTLSYYTTKHIKGQIYVEQGKTYEFKEVVDDYAALYIDDNEVLSDISWHIDSQGTYTAQESGLVGFDFYVYNERGYGAFDLSYRVFGEGSEFKTMNAESKSFYEATNVVPPQEDILYIDGGKGADTIMLSDATFRAMIQDYKNAMETKLMTFQMAEMITLGQNSVPVGDMFYNMMQPEKSVKIIMNDIEWIRYDLQNYDLKPPTSSSYVGTIYGATIDTYYRRQWDADSLREYAERNDPQTKDSLKGEIKGTLGYYTTKHITGKIYVVQGKTYEFKEVVDNYAALYIDGSKVLSDDSWSIHKTGLYKAEQSGWIDFDFYVYNETGVGHFELDYRVLGNLSAFATMKSFSENAPQNVQASTDLFDYKTAALNGVSTGNIALDQIHYLVEYADIVHYTFPQRENGDNTKKELQLDFSAAAVNHSVNLIGNEAPEKIAGSQYADIIFAGRGKDIIKGNGGNDILIGAGDDDTFVFNKKKTNDHDFIVETYDSDFSNNTLQFLDHDLSELLFVRNGKSMIITSTDAYFIPVGSVTLHLYFDGSKGSQRIIDKDGDSMVVHQSSYFKSYGYLSYGFHNAYKTAIAHETIQKALATFVPLHTDDFVY